MTHSYGKRSGTRSKFARPYRQHGLPALSTYLRSYKRGDFVTIVVNGAIQKGMPTSFYHGRTGRVFDVTKQAVGVEIAKRVGNREIAKRIHVRREHVVPSKTTEEFKNRRAENDRRARENAGSGKKLNFKRECGSVKPEAIIKGEQQELTPIRFEWKF